MSRPASRFSVALLTLALGASPSAHAQPSPLGPADFPGDEWPDAGPFGAKDRARELRQARRTDPAELARALHRTALAEYEERIRRVRAGTDTPDVVRELLPRLLEAELGLARGPADRLAAMQRHWARAREIERMTQERVEAGVKNFTPADLLLARYHRLTAALRLAQARAAAGRPLPGSGAPGPEDADPDGDRSLAREEFVAVRTPPPLLARAALEALAGEVADRLQRVRAGTDTPDVLFDIPLLRVALERTAGQQPGDAVGVLEGLWLAAWCCERLIQERVEAGVKNFTPADYYDARGRRFEAAAALAGARRQSGKLLPLKGGMQDPIAGPIAGVADLLPTKELAKDKFEAVRADPRRIAEERREALFTAYRIRQQRIEAGTDTPDVTFGVSRRLLAAELALAAGRGERRAALERFWARSRDLETLTAERVEAGVKNFTPADLDAARFDRLEAELRLAEARAGKE
jgi:hypothetical protein